MRKGGFVCNAQKRESEDLSSIFSFVKSSYLILGNPHNFSGMGSISAYLTVNNF